ncbi:probable methyltransferase-like protein 15 homolog [Planococcus citri]|uniref:probable methyltransferase-like protein 15 homolog n=1 Tax=Planococcus citri TaxID=170843 RepID=UPI0031F7E305
MKTSRRYLALGLETCGRILEDGRRANSSFVSLSGSNRVRGRTSGHVPVMVDKVVDFMQPEKCQLIVDMTFGAGGHTRKLLEKSSTVRIVCLDRDPVAFSYAQKLQLEYPDQVLPLHGKFSDLPSLLEAHNIGQNSIDAMLFDFGSSSMQFDDPNRGFALSKDGPLDMRMNTSEEDSVTAADVLAHASERDLHKILKIYGEEPQAKQIAKALVETRTSYGCLRKTSQLKDLVEQTLQNQIRLDKLGRYAHVSTRVFQALRIFVNNEMNEINYAMIVAQRYLKLGGVMVTLSFHSLEDTIVKRHVTGNVSENAANELPMRLYSFSLTFPQESLEPKAKTCWRQINKHVITPDDLEIASNPRSRSAKLRACVKIR